MSGYAGDLFIRIRPDSAGFSAGVQQQVRASEAGLIGAGTGLGRSIGKGILGGFAAVGIAQGLASQISAGIKDIATVQASTEAVKQEFGGASAAVLKFSNTAISEFGATEHATLQLDARLGVLLKNLGIAPDRAAEMAVGLETVAASIAKIRGLDPETVFANLPQALAGNLRSLKQLGFAFDQQQIKQEALRQGLISTIKGAIDPAIKAQAIYGLVTAHLGDIQAQAALHSQDLAFQQHRLTAEWDHAREQLTTALLPALTSTAKTFADDLPGALQFTERAFETLKDIVTPVASLFGGLKNVIGGLLVLKVATTLKTWAASHLLAAGAVTSETSATVANTGAVVENQVAVGRSVIIYGEFGQVLSTVAVESEAASAGLITASTGIEAAGASAAVAEGEVGLLAGSLAALSGLVVPIAVIVTFQYRNQIAGGIKEVFQGGKDFFSSIAKGNFGQAITGPPITGSAGLKGFNDDEVRRARNYLSSSNVTFAILGNGDIQAVGPDGTVYHTFRDHNSLAYEILAAEQNNGRFSGRTSASQGALNVGRNAGIIPGLLATGVLQPYQQLQLEAIRAQKTQTLADDLKVAQEIQAIFDKRVATTRFTGKKLFELEQQDAQAQLAVTNIEQQIAQNRVAAAKTRATNAKDALRQEVDILKSQITGPLDAEILRLENQLSKIQDRVQRGDLRDRLAKAKRDLANAQRSVQIIGTVTPDQRKEIAAFLQPFKREVADAAAAEQEFTLSGRIASLKTREQNLLSPLNRTARAGETQVQLLKEIVAALRANARRTGVAPAKNSKAIPGTEAGIAASTLNGSLVGHQ